MNSRQFFEHSKKFTKSDPKNLFNLGRIMKYMTDRTTIGAITLTAIGIIIILLWAIGKALGIIN